MYRATSHAYIRPVAMEDHVCYRSTGVRAFLLSVWNGEALLIIAILFISTSTYVTSSRAKALEDYQISLMF